jgi:TRAP transporter TAXI family solute receptor
MRPMRRVRAAVLGAVAGAVLLLVGCSPVASPGSTARQATGSLVISTGSPRGVYHAWGQALVHELAEVAPGLRTRVLTSSGSVENLDRVRAGTADIGLTTLDAAELDRPRTAAPPTTLARIYDDYLHLLVRDDDPARSLADLDGRTVAVGEVGSGTALVARRVLDAGDVRVRERRLPLVAAVQALTGGEVDAVFWSGGVPSGAVQDAAVATPLRLLPLTGLTGELVGRYGGVYRSATVPPRSYPGTDAVETVAGPNVLVADPELPAAVVQAVLVTVFEHREEIARRVPPAATTDRRTAIWTGDLPLHPAAAAYFRSAKP